MNRREFSYGLVTACSLPFSAYPDTPRHAKAKTLLELQQDFIDLRFGMFIHLNMATYEQREWGDPKASPKLFNPTDLQTDQWAQAAHSAKMKYGCLTTKHHDGFCLWPTATSSPSVKDASVRTDIVRSYVNSFRKYGLSPCLYFSILDLRADIRPYQVTRHKIDMIKEQLSELLTNYGEITMLVFDGWNASWSRLWYEQIPFREIYDHVKQLQPNCLVADHNAGQYPGAALFYTDIRQYEQHAGQVIPQDSEIPSQSGTTLQREWFWKLDYPEQELRSSKQIVEEWLVPFNKRNCNLILNVAPNREGRFDQNVIDRLAEIGRMWQPAPSTPPLQQSISITTPNLAFGQPSSASRDSEGTGSDLANDNNFHTYWSCEPTEMAGWLEIKFPRTTAFNTIAIVEPRFLEHYGAESRIASYRIQHWHQDQWNDIASGKSPSTCQLHQFQQLSAQRVRLSIEGSRKGPGIAEFGIYNEPLT